jgi:hypothetical protein
MSVAAFDDIPNKVVPRTVRMNDPTLDGPAAIEWIFSGYCDKLLYQNARLQDLFRQFAGKLDAPECRDCLTQGQRVRYLLGALDGQVKNGGLAQFFWNCPDMMFDVSDALEVLGETSLAGSYAEAREGLVIKKEDWIELRKRSGGHATNVWEPFQESYELLDLGWFDDAYFETYGPSLLRRLVDYVRSHKEEFIEV